MSNDSIECMRCKAKSMVILNTFVDMDGGPGEELCNCVADRRKMPLNNSDWQNDIVDVICEQCYAHYMICYHCSGIDDYVKKYRDARLPYGKCIRSYYLDILSDVKKVYFCRFMGYTLDKFNDYPDEYGKLTCDGEQYVPLIVDEYGKLVCDGEQQVPLTVDADLVKSVGNLDFIENMGTLHYYGDKKLYYIDIITKDHPKLDSIGITYWKCSNCNTVTKGEPGY